MVDVTNCDEGTAGAPDLLFLSAPSEGSWDTQYNFSAGINYKYDNVMNGLFGEGILKLADKNYEAPADSGASNQPDAAGQPDNSGNPGVSGQTDKSGNQGAAGQPDNSGAQDAAGQPDNPAGSDT